MNVGTNQSLCQTFLAMHYAYELYSRVDPEILRDLENSEDGVEHWTFLQELQESGIPGHLVQLLDRKSVSVFEGLSCEFQVDQLTDIYQCWFERPDGTRFDLQASVSGVHMMIPFRPMCLGIYRLKIQDTFVESDHTRVYLIDTVSYLGHFVASVESFFDTYSWAWTNDHWTDELENAAVHLLAAIDDEFIRLTAVGDLMSQALGMSTGVTGMFKASRDRLESAMAQACQDHDAYSVGLLSLSIRELMDSTHLVGMVESMLGVFHPHLPKCNPSHLFEAIQAFEEARLAPVDKTKMLEKLDILISAGDILAAAQASEMSNRWANLRNQMLEMRANQVFNVAQFMGLFDQKSSSMLTALFTTETAKVERSPVPEYFVSLDPQKPVKRVLIHRWSESLICSTIVLGNLFQPLLVTDWPYPKLAALCQHLLGEGLCYLSSGESSRESLLATLDHARAMVPLGNYATFLSSKQRVKRLKEVSGRTCRNLAKAGIQVSLRTNTIPMKEAVQLLRVHHPDSWVGPDLAAFWEYLVQAGQFVVFELWLDDQLAAADFAHLHGSACYVTTRFFVRAHAKWQPGYLLALAEMSVLLQLGYYLYDLGGTNSSPMMYYKNQVACEYTRHESWNEWRSMQEARRNAQPIPCGVLVQSLQAHHYYGFRALESQAARRRNPRPEPTRPLTKRDRLTILLRKTFEKQGVEGLTQCVQKHF